MSASLSPGIHLGGAYTLRRPLGEGGSGEVWLAVEDTLGRDVALKISRAADDGARDRFLAEARSLAAVSHRGVAPVLGHGVDAATGRAFLAMPVFPDTLAARLDREGRLSESETAALGLSLVPAIDALHSAGIAHRDLKPSNILLNADGAPVLADIGPEGGGTRTWAAPEQLSPESNNSSPVTRHSSLVPVGTDADWHALGLLLYRALVGTLPPPRGILPAAVEPPRGTLPRDLRPRPLRGWEPLLRALLEPDPARRLTDVGAILRALRRLRRRALRRERTGRILHRLRFAKWGVVAACVIVALIATALWRPNRENSTERGNAPEGQGGVFRAEPKHSATSRLESALGNEERPLARLQGFLATAMDVSAPDADGVVRVPTGRVLLADEIPVSGADPAPTVLLDGGTLLFGPPRDALQTLARSWQARADLLRETGDPDSDLPPVIRPLNENDVFFPCRVLVTDKGGTLVAYDEGDGDGRALVTNVVARAAGVETAKLHCDGFSFLVLNRDLLDEGLTVTGRGSVAEFGADGKCSKRRWFDDSEPL